MAQNYYSKTAIVPLNLIGQGGFGRTFLAIDEDKPSKPYCVIKQFFPASQGTNNISKAAELFEKEATRLDELGRHSQIPELMAHFTPGWATILSARIHRWTKFRPSSGGRRALQ